ncbi:hypothetical protein GLYMA_15G143800v4 [Glycine max]|nr:hypothetical protein GLYMA_15G143800v4 [Glycine max]KAG4381425.1 hypothetical protein GLYMA_15G143800v4 [Glycine max]KAH1147160.1 hypothetical protein GYH30_042363 [Glycine max]KAH1147162.1 hypothetical protein GYH30_042363 [Glycine max]
MAGCDKEDYFSAPNAEQGAGVNQQSTATVETLRPKLQRTPHQQLPPRRPACTSG